MRLASDIQCDGDFRSTHRISASNGSANAHHIDESPTSGQQENQEKARVENDRIVVRVPTDSDMRKLGEHIARMVRGSDVLLLSGPLGAGKTTFAQGFGAGLGISNPIVSPTFTIARELDGRFLDGNPAHLVHVDAYRLGGNTYAPGQNGVDELLDQLESLGLDEELEDPSDDTVVLMEWGEQMVAALAPERLEIHIDRTSGDALDDDDRKDCAPDGKPLEPDDELSSDGERMVTFVPIGKRWNEARISDTILDGVNAGEKTL